jgi:predicted Rdx family selenoprotein
VVKCNNNKFIVRRHFLTANLSDNFGDKFGQKAGLPNTGDNCPLCCLEERNLFLGDARRLIGGGLP